MERLKTTPAMSTRTICCCALLIIAFALLSWFAVLQKSPTVDEPLHALSGWVNLTRDDFRLDPETPPASKIWAALPNAASSLHTVYTGAVWNDLSWDLKSANVWCYQTLWQTPGNDGAAFIRRGRAMMLLLGIALATLIACWAHRLGGAPAALIATTFYCFDPNFIGFAPIIKSDVPTALLFLAVACCCWAVGRHATLLRTAALAIVCGLAIDTKFSALLLVPAMGLLFTIRILHPAPWLVMGKPLVHRRSKLLSVSVISVFAAAVVMVMIWACYGFRFRPAPGAATAIDMEAIARRTLRAEATADHPSTVPTADELMHRRGSTLMQAILFCNRHHLLPQAMLGGLLDQHAATLIWPAFLCGQLYSNGRWYYFPLAVLFKTPLATLVAALLGTLWLIRRVMRLTPSRMTGPTAETDQFWTTLCLTISPAVLGIAAIGAHVNIGLRSILPIYPFIYIGLGCVVARIWQDTATDSIVARRGRRWLTILIAALGLGLAAETFSAFPGYISFFNTAAGGARGGFALLGDSNLDWGQDLKPLVEWQKQHPDVPIYLHYFGLVDPGYEGLRYHPLTVAADGKSFQSDVSMIPGVMAVSTNFLQGLYDEPQEQNLYRRLGQQEPDAVIGDSIYLYRYPR